LLSDCFMEGQSANCDTNSMLSFVGINLTGILGWTILLYEKTMENTKLMKLYLVKI
jgi:hypothetical protein